MSCESALYLVMARSQQAIAMSDLAKVKIGACFRRASFPC